MISFDCPSCHQNYSVTDDRAGKRTACAKCRTPLIVPEPCDVEVLEADAEVRGIAKRPRRPPTTVVFALIAGSVLFLFAFGWFLNFLTPNPSRETIEQSLREKLPPGYEDFRLDSYDRETTEAKFSVKYRDYGDIIGVTYEVVRFEDKYGFSGGPGWKVQIIGRRAQLERPYEKWLMVHVVFDRTGKLVHKRLSAADSVEGPRFEERARQIAQAVNGSF